MREFQISRLVEYSELLNMAQRQSMMESALTLTRWKLLTLKSTYSGY